MELLIGYSALGFISGFCFDIVVFFFVVPLAEKYATSVLLILFSSCSISSSLSHKRLSS